jgi:uncharacterized OB-fold protein
MASVPFPDLGESSAIWWSEGDRLVVGRCTACSRVHHYPRRMCPFCHSTETELLEVSGCATVTSYALSRSKHGLVQRVVAFVTLDVGVAMLTEIVSCDPSDVAIGLKVGVTPRGSFADDAPRFSPLETSAAK